MTPDKYTNEELMLDVGEGHTLYVHDWGNKDALAPILYLHGGPGDGCKDRNKGLFDPAQQRIIFFDQRGSGRSTPAGSLEHNTTAEIIADIVKILDTFEVKQCILTGGSWGSALSFYFGIAHPERVSAIVVDGIFTGSRAEISWLDDGGYKATFPDVWDEYVASVPPAHRSDPTAYHAARIIGNDTAAVKESGYTYERLEGRLLSLDDRYAPQDLETYDPSGIRVEVFYLANACFVPERYVFENASKLAMPIYLVQGRYDMVCPPITAYELNRVLPASELIWTTSGHRNERESWNVKRTILKQLTA